MKNSGEFNDLSRLRQYNQNKLVIARLNNNSFRNKFELLTEKTKGNVDILFISETKIGESFSDIQLKISCFSNCYRVNRKYTFIW